MGLNYAKILYCLFQLGPLKRNFVQCKKCNFLYHKSCADCIGYVEPGIVKKCCKVYNSSNTTEESSLLKSFGASSSSSVDFHSGIMNSSQALNSDVLAPVGSLEYL